MSELSTTPHAWNSESFTEGLPEFFVNPWCKPRLRYHQFTIPKKSGGVRTISAPCDSLKDIQSSIAFELEHLYQPLVGVMGFIPKKSIADNAKVHAGRRFVFNADLQDFFPSIRMGRVTRALIQPPYSIEPDEAKKIAGICCIADASRNACVLPQGAPSSPILSNIVCEGLDRKLTVLAKRLGARYTRYADDITFSSNRNIFYGRKFISNFEEIVSSEGFTINEKKTRIQNGDQRQEVTGITVNRKPNVSKDFLRELRMLIHICEKYGVKDAHMRYCKHRFSKLENIDIPVPNIESVIEGKLSFLRMVKGKDDPVYRSLRAKFRKCFRKESPVTYTVKQYSVDSFQETFNTKLEIRKKECSSIHLFMRPDGQNGRIFGPKEMDDYYAVCYVDGRKQFVWFSLEAAIHLNRTGGDFLSDPSRDNEAFIIEQHVGANRSFWKLSLVSPLSDMDKLLPQRVRCK